MKSPTSIFLLSCKQIVLDLDAFWLGYRCLCDIPADHKAWEKEERPAIFTSPMSGWELKLRVEGETVVD